jgi:hypothetical protein
VLSDPVPFRVGSAVEIIGDGHGGGPFRCEWYWLVIYYTTQENRVASVKLLGQRNDDALEARFLGVGPAAGGTSARLSAATAIQHVAIVHDGPNATRRWRRRGGDGQKQVGELSTLVDVENVVLASSQGHQWPRWAA